MSEVKTRILVLGASGMLGSTIFQDFSRDPTFETFGTIRDDTLINNFAIELRGSLITNVSAVEESGILTAMSIAKPDVVINCIGIIKQLPDAKHHFENIAINAMLPHRLAKYCTATSARLIHFSTDCVFSGFQGRYKEYDTPDANDLYGRTKFLGEVSYENTITLRTSIIGHEINRAKSLVDWFLNQSEEVKGFNRAVFSGLPTIVVSHTIKNFVIPNTYLKGLYHLSGDPINKYDLLNLIAQVYQKDIKIIADDKLVIDRSLNSDRFRLATGFKPKPWSDLISEMHNEYLRTHKKRDF